MRIIYFAGAIGSGVIYVVVELYARVIKRRRKRTQFVVVDEAGNEIHRSERTETPKPDRVSRNGLGRIQGYIERLLGSQQVHYTLLIFTPDGQRGVSLTIENSRVSIALAVDCRREKKRELAVRAFFAERGIEPFRDYLAGSDKAPATSRILEYPVAGDADSIVAICRQVLQELCLINDREGLDFTLYRP